MAFPFDPYIGQAAGVATSVLWSLTTLFFAAASKRLGPAKVNAARILMAVVWLGLTHRLLSGVWVPVANGRQVLYLALSGLVGLSIGDLALFTAFVRIGPRLSSLLMTTAPIFAALFGWLALGETLNNWGWLGMTLTIGGVAWVVLERPTGTEVTAGDGRVSGVILAVVAAACQGGGLLLSKQGMGHGWLPREAHMPPQTAAFLRMFFAGVFVLPLIGWLAARTSAAPALGAAALTPQKRRVGILFTVGGSIVGPFLGVWMSLVASDKASLGVAQTLCSLTPVFILPLIAMVYKERISLRAILGACVAVGGTALLFVKAGGG